MRKGIGQIGWALMALAATSAGAFAQDTGATTNGDWSIASIWTGGTVPNSSNNVYIGSTYPSGAASTATVTISGNQSANTVELGYGSSTSGTLDLTGGTLTVGNLFLGWYNSGAVGVVSESGGSFAAGNVYVGNGNSLSLGTSDVVSGTLEVYGSTATTSATGNLTGNVDVYAASTLNMGANLNLGNGSLDVENTGSVVNMNGNNITAGTILLGWYDNEAVTLDRGTTPGSLSATNLYYYGGGGTFNLLTSDSVTNFTVYNGNTTLNSGVAVSTLTLEAGSTGTTTTTGNVTGGVNVLSSSTLNLGANLSLPTGSLDVENTGSVLNINGNNISAQTILLGWYSGQAVTLDRGTTPGSLTATNLYVAANTLNLIAADSFTNLNLSNAILTTAATSNLTGGVEVDQGSTLHLGANLSLSGSLDILNGSTLNAHGFGITTNQLTVGYFGISAASLINTGIVEANFFYMGNGSALTLHGGDIVNNSITLTQGSTLTVQQTSGTGLTLNGAFTGALTIDPSSMDLIFNLNTAPNWDFRWADPAGGGNWISTLDAMILSGQIVITAPQGYSVDDRGGYTYIDGLFATSVPEPSSLVLGALALAGVAIGVRRNRRKTGR